MAMSCASSITVSMELIDDVSVNCFGKTLVTVTLEMYDGSSEVVTHCLIAEESDDAARKTKIEYSEYGCDRNDTVATVYDNVIACMPGEWSCVDGAFACHLSAICFSKDELPA